MQQIHAGGKFNRSATTELHIYMCVPETDACCGIRGWIPKESMPLVSRMTTENTHLTHLHPMNAQHTAATPLRLLQMQTYKALHTIGVLGY